MKSCYNVNTALTHSMGFLVTDVVVQPDTPFKDSPWPGTAAMGD